jgi:hypothetical protein
VRHHKANFQQVLREEVFLLHLEQLSMDLSIGVITKSVVNLENSIAPDPRTKHTMNVVNIPRIAYN